MLTVPLVGSNNKFLSLISVLHPVAARPDNAKSEVPAVVDNSSHRKDNVRRVASDLCGGNVDLSKLVLSSLHSTGVTSDILLHAFPLVLASGDDLIGTSKADANPF